MAAWTARPFSPASLGHWRETAMTANSLEPDITPDMIAEHGLTAEEYARVVSALGREPNLTELGIFSVMWSEHCSYKSTRIWLATLPTEAPWVIQGPGENAGVVDIGDGQAAVFKMESHNHPSFIEPREGAATGVGGIMRDVFTMGARPVANLNALRFGASDHPRTRHLVSGVVSGIGGYGNCVGVPTVGGEVEFHPGYNGNNLVNAMTVGIAPKDRIFYSAAAGIGNPVIYVGSKTGRDGIHGATMASAEFDDGTEEKRPTVQIGDPFTEKLLIEACLELMATDAIVAIQDMGAAGLTCSSVEMADKGGVGIELDLDAVPQRESGMTAYEIMLSESQERMLMVLRPDAEEMARAVFEKWELDFAVIGRLADDGHLSVRQAGEVVAAIPVRPLVDDAPVYERPWAPAPAPAPLLETGRDVHPIEALRRLMACPDLASRRWIWEQYDHMVMADTIERPGGDAAVVRVHGTTKALAMTTDCTPRYCRADPETGGAQAVVETWRNLVAVGARPLAITDCLNFGNPERPEIMGQLVGCIRGMARACETLDYPVVSGNVSLYNETNGQAIPPTPVIGGLGLIADLEKRATIALKRAGDVVALVGEGAGHLGQSLYRRELLGAEDGPPPPLDPVLERRTGEALLRLIEAGRLDTCHDLSDGGLLVAAAEMALAGTLGLELVPPGDGSIAGWTFGEDQARYLIAAPPGEMDGLLAALHDEGVAARAIGQVEGDALTLRGHGHISLGELRALHEATLPRLMGAD